MSRRTVLALLVCLGALAVGSAGVAVYWEDIAWTYERSVAPQPSVALRASFRDREWELYSFVRARRWAWIPGEEKRYNVYLISDCLDGQPVRQGLLHDKPPRRWSSWPWHSFRFFDNRTDAPWYTEASILEQLRQEVLQSSAKHVGE